MSGEHTPTKIREDFFVRLCERLQPPAERVIDWMMTTRIAPIRLLFRFLERISAALVWLVAGPQR